MSYFNNKYVTHKQGVPLIGFCSEKEKLFIEDITEYENLLLYGILNSLNKDIIEMIIDFYLTELRMQDFRNTKAKELSSGNR